MAVTATPAFPQTPLLAAAALLSTTGAFTFAAASNVTTNLVSLVAGGTNGVLVEALTVSSSDTAGRDLVLILNNGTYNFPLMTTTIPANSGFNASTQPIDLLRMVYTPGLPVDTSGNRYIYVPAGSTLYVGTLTAVTAAKQVSIVAVGATF